MCKFFWILWIRQVTLICNGLQINPKVLEFLLKKILSFVQKYCFSKHNNSIFIFNTRCQCQPGWTGEHCQIPEEMDCEDQKDNDNSEQYIVAQCIGNAFRHIWVRYGCQINYFADHWSITFLHKPLIAYFSIISFPEKRTESNFK